MVQKKKMSYQSARRLAREEMTAATQQVAQKFEEKLCKINRRRVLTQYDLGAKTEDLLTSPEVYGEDGLGQFAAFINIEGGTKRLCEMRNVAIVFSREFIAEQASTPTSAGDFLHFEDFVALAKIPSETLRTELLRSIRADELSVAQLHQLVTTI